MSSNSAFGVAGTGPAAGYSLLISLFHYMLFVMSSACFMFVSISIMDRAPVLAIIYVIFYFIFWIKMNRKIPQVPTKSTTNKNTVIVSLMLDAGLKNARSPRSMANSSLSTSPCIYTDAPCVD